MGVGHSAPGGLIAAPRNVRLQTRAFTQRNDDVLSAQLYNQRVSDAENNNLATLVSSVSESMVEFVNIEGEVGVPPNRPSLLHVVPPAPQLHRLFNEHNASPVTSAPLSAAPALPSLARPDEDTPVSLRLTMDGNYSADIPIEAAFIGVPGRLPSRERTVFFNGEFIPGRGLAHEGPRHWVSNALAAAAAIGIGVGFAIGISYLASKSAAATSASA